MRNVQKKLRKTVKCKQMWRQDCELIWDTMETLNLCMWWNARLALFLQSCQLWNPLKPKQKSSTFLHSTTLDAACIVNRTVLVNTHQWTEIIILIIIIHNNNHNNNNNAFLCRDLPQSARLHTMASSSCQLHSDLWCCLRCIKSLC